MEEDAELEEGEAKEALDPDTDFSYLDKKLELVLGDYQREFQGGNLSTEKLGSKYGGYGTFLPTHARAPSMLTGPHPAAPAAESGRPAAEETVEPVKRLAGTTIQQVSQTNNGAAVSTLAAKTVRLKIKLKGAEAQRKAIYNGLCLEDSSSASLDDDDDDDTYSRSNVESPTPSPMTIIQIMTSHTPQGGLLSPLCNSVLDVMDAKENGLGLLKPRNQSTATFSAHSTASKGDLEPPLGPGLENRKGKGRDREKQVTVEGKKGIDLVVDGDGGKRPRRESDTDKKGLKEPTGQGLGKEHIDSGRELPKGSRKQLDTNRTLGGNSQKEKEGNETKLNGKVNALKERDNKEIHRSKESLKVSARKDSDLTRPVDAEKESSDKFGCLADVRKQGIKEDMKEGVASKGKESHKEGVKDSQRKDSVGEVKVKDLHKESSKSAGNPGVATKKTSNSAASRKGIANDQKGSKSVQDRKSSLKEVERERVNLPELLVSTEDEKIPAKIELLPASLVAPQILLDNWVLCDKCEQWRLLMPNVDPDSLPKKWRCKMMYWLPGMNNCKYKEEETTAAVYAYLGYQNPAIPPAIAPALQQPPAPVVEPTAEKWADQADTKKASFLSNTKKGVARKMGGGGVKGTGNKGVDGAVKSKNLNDVGVDSSADVAGILSDKHRHVAKEKNKRARPLEGEDTRAKKKVLQAQEHNVESTQMEKDASFVEPNQAVRGRVDTVLPEGNAQGLSSVPAKRKKLGTSDDVDETPYLKKSKGGRVKMQVDEPQVPSEEDYDETDKWASHRGRNDYSKDTHHSSMHDKDIINSVLKDIRDHDSCNDKRREEREGTKMYDEERRLKGKPSDRQRKSKGDQSDSEQRLQERRKEADARAERGNPADPHEKHMDVKDDHNLSTSSKISASSAESSGEQMKAVSSPVESTVSSSPVRAMNGNTDFPTSREGPGDRPLFTDSALRQQSCSPGPKHGRDASRGSSWDEGEFRHAGGGHNSTRFRKADANGEAQDDDWYYNEDRGADHGHNLSHHRERQVHGSLESDETDEHRRRKYENRDRDSDRVRRGIRGSSHADHDDQYSRETNPRDDRGRPSLRESGPEKPGERSWDDDLKPDGRNHVLNREEVPTASLQGLGFRDGGLSNDHSREGDRNVSNVRKDGGSAVGPSDAVVAIKRPGVSLNARVIADRGEPMKREEAGPVKASVGEGAAGSPAKKEHVQAHHLANVAIKDATNLKHSADRLKGIPGNDSTNLYLQAALKFLLAASMLEPIHAESARQGEVTQSMKLYNDTARLCEFCATTYERSRDLRASALAYTCAAVARARVLMSKQLCFARDCKEFQSAAQLTSGTNVASNGDSPSSSSASDVDNLNNHHGLGPPGNKVTLGKLPFSPQLMAGATGGTSHIISAHLRPVMSRFLRDANDMNALLDSWRKAAEATAKAEASNETEGMAAVKQVGEMGGFGDIDGVVRLVRVAMDAIGH